MTFGRPGNLGSRSATPYRSHRRNTSSPQRIGRTRSSTPPESRNTRANTKKMKEAAETEEREKSKMETERLQGIEEEHADESDQLGQLRATGWFKMGLDKFTTLPETIKYAEDELLNSKSIKSIVKLKTILKKQQKNLSKLTTAHVNDVSFYEIFPKEDRNHPLFKALLEIAPNSIKGLTFKNIPDNTGDSFESYYSPLFDKQRKLGLDTIQHLLAKINGILNVWLKKNKSTRPVGIGTRKNLKFRRRITKKLQRIP